MFLFLYSLLMLAYLVVCGAVVGYVAYCLFRDQRLSRQTAMGASILFLPLCLMIVSELAADDIDLNPPIESSHELEGTYSLGSQRLTLQPDGTFTSTGLFSTASGTWTLGSFTVNLSGVVLSPRVVTCNGDLCIAPYYEDVDEPIGLLLKRSPAAPSEKP